MKKHEAYINENSFGSDIPDTWEADAAFLNALIDQMEEGAEGEVSDIDLENLWEDYCAGKFDGMRALMEKYDFAVTDCQPGNFTHDGQTIRGWMFGNDECFNGNEFYQYVFSVEGKLYRLYYSLDGADGEQITDLSNVDYSAPYHMEDCTSEFC